MHKWPPAKGGFRGIGDKRLNKYDFVLHEAVLHVSLKLFKMPNNCQNREKDKIKTRKQTKKKFKSFFLSFKARCAHQSGRDKVCLFNKVLPPPFPGFQCLGKSSHFMSTVLQNRNSNKFQHEYSKKKKKKHKIFRCWRDWMNSLGGYVCLSTVGHLLTKWKWNCLMMDSWLKCYAPNFKLKPYMNN